MANLKLVDAERQKLEGAAEIGRDSLAEVGVDSAIGRLTRVTFAATIEATCSALTAVAAGAENVTSVAEWPDDLVPAKVAEAGVPQAVVGMVGRAHRKLVALLGTDEGGVEGVEDGAANGVAGGVVGVRGEGVGDDGLGRSRRVDEEGSSDAAPQAAGGGKSESEEAKGRGGRNTAKTQRRHIAPMSKPPPRCGSRSDPGQKSATVVIFQRRKALVVEGCHCPERRRRRS